jgi:hypothetical protein
MAGKAQGLGAGADPLLGARGHAPPQDQRCPRVALGGHGLVKPGEGQRDGLPIAVLLGQADTFLDRRRRLRELAEVPMERGLAQ